MKVTKKILAIVLSLVMTFGTVVFTPSGFDTTVKADENGGLITSFQYDFAYATPGYADGTFYISAKEDGVYKIFWGDENGNKLTNKGKEYSYLARIVVQDGHGSFNIINDHTAIPDGAKTVLVYKKSNLEYTYNIPQEKQFKAGSNAYTFGSLSDPHFTRYSSVAEDDAVPAMDKAMNFLDDAGIKFVAMSGDLSQAGEQLAFDRFNEALDRHPNMTVLTAIGNHDSRTTLSTSNKKLLDTSVSRWYNSITSNYFTVDADGTIHNKLDGHEILASDALTNPIDTVYRETEDGEEIPTTVPGLDFVTEAGGNIFIFFNNIAKTGETYDTDKLITTGQMDWLEEQLEKYKDKNIFLYQHYYLAVNTLDNDAQDYNNCTGDLKNAGGYSYDLDFKDVVKTTGGKNLQALLTQYKNTTLVTGHSHWQYSMQGINKNINFGRLANGNGGTMIHLSSVTEPRYIAQDDPGRTSLNGYASEGATITTYSDCTVYNNIDFENEQYEAYATYIVPTGKDSQYEPVKNAGYKESTDEITGDEYLDAEDLTEVQLLKSDFNLLKGAAYTYSSKGTENTDTALTDGSSTGTFCNTKWGAKGEQRITVTLDGVQDVSNLNCFMLYFVSDITCSKKFNIQLSLNGEDYETVYESPSDYSYKNRVINIDRSKINLTQYKYVRLNMSDGAKDYGFQVRELAAIGYSRNATPNTAGSASTLEGGGPIDESDMLDTDYNLAYAAEYTQSSVGSENKEGALTDGKISGGFVNTERNSSAKEQTFVLDLGKSKVQDVSNIKFLLLYNQNALTNVTDFDVSISFNGENFETIGKYSGVEPDQEHFDVDLSKVTLEKFRYVKLHFTNGNTGYGYQIKEFGVIGVNPIEYPEIADQSANVSNANKNYALNKTVYVSSTYANEGKDPTVLTDGKKDKYWSSDWDSKRTSDYVVIDLGKDIDASMIGRVLVNFKSNNTFCSNYSVEVSKTFDGENPDEGFYEIGKTKAVSWEILQKSADPNGYVATDITDVEQDLIRYVKINMKGHATYGFQIYEIAVLEAEKDIAKAQINVDKTEFDYTGEEVSPNIVVTYAGVKLTEGIDYTVVYKNNIDVGTATATVVGKDEYAGSKVIKYNINQADISNAKISIDVDEENKEVFSVECNGNNLIQDKDYTVSLNKENYILSYTINGIGNYKGEIKDSRTDITSCSIVFKEIGAIYSGKAIEQEFTVVDEANEALKRDTDYSEKYNNNVNAGEAEVVVTGQGKYYGTIRNTFKISSVDINDITIDYSQVKTSYEFIGKDITPIIKFRYNGMNLNTMADFTVEYKENFYPGTASIVIKGIDNYTGEYTKTFNIVKRQIGNVTIKTGFNSNKQLVVTVNNGSYNMTKGVDYNYTVVTDAKGNITITFTGLGNYYSGTVVKTIPASENPNAPVPVTTPKIKKVTVKSAVNQKGRKIKLTWKKVSNATGYNIRYALSKKKLKKAKLKKVKKNKLNYTIKKLKNKKKYFVQVRAFVVVKGKVYNGAWSKAKGVKIKK